MAGKIQGRETGGAYDEAVKLYYSITAGTSATFEPDQDSEEYELARDELGNYLEENIKDETILKGIEDFNGTLLLIAESIGFVKGFKVAAALGARKSALPELNEKLLEREEGNEH